jgi:thiol-disulfide isomerase/thioredoxin
MPLSMKAQIETISQNRAEYIGVKTKSFFKKQPHVKWFDESYDGYHLNQKTIKKIKKNLDGITIKVFMSVWCHDSHREIPRLYKILEAANFNENNMQIIALNRVKKTPNNLQEGFDIRRTPTLIFYKNGNEISRFVEHPQRSLEKDILKIISGKNYKHAYFKSFLE